MGCGRAEDVARALDFAQSHNLSLAVRAGGHSRIGYGMCDGVAAVSRLNLSHMAFALRKPGYEIDMAGVWSAPAEKEEVVRWVNAACDTLLPFSHGVYVNQLGRHE